MHFQLPVGTFDVSAYRVRRDAQPLGDLGVAAALGEQPYHVSFTQAEASHG